MKRTYLILCAAIAIGSVGVVSAQYGGGQTSSKGYGHKSKNTSEVTLTGCLEEGTSPNTFVLRNATETAEGGSTGSSSSQMSGTSSQGTSGSEGTTGTSSTGSSAQSTTGSQSAMDFELVGKSKDLKKYVGQRVEVRGKVEPMDNSSGMSRQNDTSSGSSTGDATGTSGTTGSGSQSGGSSMSGQSSSSGALTHRVKVSSVKQLSSSCQ